VTEELFRGKKPANGSSAEAVVTGAAILARMLHDSDGVSVCQWTDIQLMSIGIVS
jgi:hypothetical protein